MNGEQDKILSMLEEGTISADEAEALLGAVETQAEQSIAPHASPTVGNPPDMDRLRSFWRIPFSISLGVLVLSGLLLSRARRGLRLLLWPLTLVAAVATLVSYLSKDSPWLHVRVREDNGQQIAISLPVPSGLLRGIITLVRRNSTDPQLIEQLESTAAFLDAMRSETDGDPFFVEIEEENSHVQVFLG